MFLSKDRQKFVKAVGILIIIQGIAWLAMALAGILVYSSPPDKLTSYKSYSQYLARIIYRYSMSNTDDKVIRSQDFHAFLWIYVILSAVWIAAALDQNFAIRYKKTRQSYITLVLGVTILLTSIIDLVFFSLLARDFTNCPFDEGIFTVSTPSTPISTPTISTTTTSTASSITTTTTMVPGTPIDCQLANGIVMSIAARGYILWIINVVLGICLINIGAKVIRIPAILNYDHNTIPRVKIPEQRKQPSPNNELNFFRDNDVFTSPAPPLNGGKNRNTTPVSLANKNQSIYY